MRRKRRRIPALQIGERRQYQPGELAASLDPALCERLEALALAGYAAQGRGLLIVTLDTATETGIISAEYLPLHELVDAGHAVPLAEARPAMLAVQHYDPEKEFMALVLDVTPTLPTTGLVRPVSTNGTDDPERSAFGSAAGAQRRSPRGDNQRLHRHRSAGA